MFAIGDDDIQIDPKSHIYNAVLYNCRILHRFDQWSQKCYLEAKQLNPEINCGIPA